MFSFGSDNLKLGRLLAVMTAALALIVGASGALASSKAEVRSVRTSSSADGTRVVFDLSQSVSHSLFTLENPSRVVIDLRDTRMRAGNLRVRNNDLVSGLRHATRKGRDLRVVLDLATAATPKSFLLGPSGKHGHRLVVDLVSEVGSGKAGQSVKQTPIKSTQDLNKQQSRDVVIAIDAGHGGQDPGAIGKRGTREKDTTLAVARRLEKLVNAQRGMRAVLIRKGDYYMKLRTRIRKAREAKADLFVSIHADGFKDPSANGSSVYILSPRGATSEAARWLAKNENKADLVGGVSLDDKDDDLAKVLLDLSLTATIEASHTAAANVLDELKGIGKVHKRSVERAAFVVLKSPDIPSMLVETAFISNPQEERRLRNAAHQRKMAKAIMRGIRAYFARHSPPGTWFAQQRQRNLATNKAGGGNASQHGG